MADVLGYCFLGLMAAMLFMVSATCVFVGVVAICLTKKVLAEAAK